MIRMFKQFFRMLFEWLVLFTILPKYIVTFMAWCIEQITADEDEPESDDQSGA